MEQIIRPQLELSTRCGCGSVSVSVSGRVYAMLLCSCEDCQKATGTGHAAVAFANANNVTVDGPVKAFARTANSGATFTRHFCPECGTPLFGKSSRAPRFTMLPVGLFGKDTDWFVPSQMIFARSHREWDAIPEDLVQHQTYRENGGL